MGLLSKLRGGGDSNTATETIEAPPCPHVSLLPRWDSIDDMGDDNKAVSFTCEACGQVFEPAEAMRLRASEEERVRNALDTTALETTVEEQGA
jgi:hypothetical protein